MLKDGDLVTAKSLTEPGQFPKTLEGILQIVEAEGDDIYPPFKAYFVAGQEADEGTIRPQMETKLSISPLMETLSTISPSGLAIYEEEEEEEEEAPTISISSGPYNRFSNVYEAAERMQGNHPYGTRGHKTYTEDTLRQAYRIITNQTPSFLEDRSFYKDAAILLAAIPQSPLSRQTLYRGIQEFEITRSRAGAQPGVEFDMPIAKVTTSLTAPLNGALVLKITEPTPWIKTEGTPASYPDEGIVSGRFRVTQVSGNVVTAVQISDYLEQANEALLTNGWDFGEDIAAITASITPLPLTYDYLKEFKTYLNPVQGDIFPHGFDLFKPFPFVKEDNDGNFREKYLTAFVNECHDPQTGRFCFTKQKKLHAPRVRPEDFKAAPITKVAIDDLYSSQKFLSYEKVDYHKDNPNQPSEWDDKYPWVTLNKDRTMTIADGHHRIAAAAEKGQTHIKVKLLDVPKLKEEQRKKALKSLENNT